MSIQTIVIEQLTTYGGSELNVLADEVRIGRAVLFVNEAAKALTDGFVVSKIASVIDAGQAMDFAARIKEVPALNHSIVVQFANLSGIPEWKLVNRTLPALEAAGVIEFRVGDNNEIAHIEEFVGVSKSVARQTVDVLNCLKYSPIEYAFLMSVDIGAMSPLTENDHLQQISRKGASDSDAREAVRLARVTRLLMDVQSQSLRETVVYSPHIWGAKHVRMAEFMRNLPPNERDELLQMSDQVLSYPGIQTRRLAAAPGILKAAEGAGIIQTAQVLTSTGQQASYSFSPLIEANDDSLVTSEALHQRKLFVAHMLYGVEQAKAGYGKIQDPKWLVQKLIERGTVGPATNISTDYVLLEQHGVVAVDGNPGTRAYLKLMKKEIAQAGLEWIKNLDSRDASVPQVGTDEPLKLFRSPEQNRNHSASQVDNESQEVIISAVLELRKEAQQSGFFL
ncbi:hypothetical protein SAMN04487849_101319 [Micrococcus luteus]|uniref:Uncharacterized protein n=1 Tax=Micrococcus luteus TaxID=1270 RepID=A0ABD7M5S4_MICLU|nr:hypothetical protein [Micrococcus luteus]SHL33458.1 hypothetical protein SAMN04487849_101319 [Micrococcus luteus]